jgi:hypothetical protein
VAEGVALAVVQAGCGEELLRRGACFVRVSLAPFAVQNVPRDQAPSKLDDAGEIARRGSSGGDGMGVGAADGAEEGEREG